MREITSHRLYNNKECVAGRDLVRVFAADEPNDDGASHEYVILLVEPSGIMRRLNTICIQKGASLESKANGLNVEAMVSIAIDVLAGYQSGPHECEETKLALHALKLAMQHLHHRTVHRIARGVEGTSQL